MNVSKEQKYEKYLIPLYIISDEFKKFVHEPHTKCSIPFNSKP